MRRAAPAKPEHTFEKPAPPIRELPLTKEEKLNIVKFVEMEEADGDVLDETGLKKLILLFEKRNLKKPRNENEIS